MRKLFCWFAFCILNSRERDYVCFVFLGRGFQTFLSGEPLWPKIFSWSSLRSPEILSKYFKNLTTHSINAHCLLISVIGHMTRSRAVARGLGAPWKNIDVPPPPPPHTHTHTHTHTYSVQYTSMEPNCMLFCGFHNISVIQLIKY